MKRQHKVISFILVLSLLFSSLIFTAGAESAESLDDVNKIEFYEPTATFTKVTPNSKGTAYGEFFGHIGLSGVYDVTGDTQCLTTYVAETYNGESTNRYLMLTPTQEAINDHTISSNGHSQINIGTDTIVWRNDDSKYYVFELDMATESNFLDMDFEVITRYNDANTSGSWGTRYSPSSNFQMLISEGGMFHHVTFVGDLDNNKLYVFVDNQLVDVVNDALMGTDLHNKYMAGTEAIILRSMRIQKSPAPNSIIADSSIYLGRAEMRILGENDEDNYADNIRVVLKYGDLSAWGENNYYPEEQSYVPDVIEINGVKYNNTVAASNALQTFKLGTKAKALRSCYGGNINVNCDAEFTVPMGADINLVAGDDVEVVKGDGNIWLSVIKTFKHSAKVVSKNPSYFASSVIYPALDNLITNVKQESAINSRTFKDTEFADLITDLDLTAEEQALFTFNESANTYTLNSSIFNSNESKTLAEKFRNHSIDGSIVRTDGGNEYLIVQDNSGKAGDFPLNVHYQVNAQITPTKLNGHNYIVFEQDIYSESQFINVYSVFNVRTPSDKSLSSTQVFADKVSITPEKWHHLTYIGEVATGDSYIFLDGKCVAKVKSGLYDNSAVGMVAVSMGKIGDSSKINSYSGQEFADFAAELTAEQKTDCVNNMVLHTFRTMQIAGENKSGKDLTPDMSAASDNYYLRWADESSMSTLINKISNDYEDNNVIDGSYNISDWSANIYGSSYKTPERAVIATINGVEYYDTTHINEVLNNASYTKALQEVVLYREYVGTIVVNCRATVKLNGINSRVVFNEYDAETNPTGCIVDRSQNPIVVYMQTPEDGEYPNIFDTNTYRTSTASTANILTQWKSSKSGNLYTTVQSLSNSSNTVQIDKFNTSTKQYAYDSTQPIYDTGAQTHTIPVNQTMTAYHVDMKGSSKNDGWWNYAYTVTLDTTVTQKQYYLVMEFDIAQVGTSGGSISIKNTVNGTVYPICDDISAYLSPNVGEYNHITIVGQLTSSLHNNIEAQATASGTNVSFAYAPEKTSTVKHALDYKVYVNNEYKVSSAHHSYEIIGTTFDSSWENVIIQNSGRSLTVDNMFIGLDYTTTAKTMTTSKKGSSSSNQSTALQNAVNAYNSDGDQRTMQASELDNIAGTTTDNTTLDTIFASNTINDSRYGATANPKPDKITPADMNAQTKYQDGTYDMDYPIASVDGVLYYADGAKAPNGTLYANTESDLKALLEMPNDTQRIVTFLREPTTEITIIANAQVDANGLNLDKITLGNQDCVVAEGTNVSTVINLTGTTVVAVMNGVQYLANQIAELQAAVTASNEVTISFYSVPSTPIKITSVANIKTNGILNDGTTQDELFTTDEINFVISKIDSIGAEYDYTIIKKIRTATVEVRVVKDGTTISTVKVDGDFGTDIAELLTNKGLMSGVFVVNGEQLNVTNWDVTPSGIINKENNGSESAYVYTATVDNSKSITVTEKYAYVTASGITQSNSESDVRNWFSDGGNGTIVFFDDLTVTTASSITLNGSGKSVQLNGHSINFETMMLNSQGNVEGIHGFVPGDNATVNFYGDGTINYLTNAGTEALLFTNYTFAGTITFNNITINASSSIARLRGGNAEFNGCDINSYNYSSTKMFELGEQYNSGASAIPMTLILKNCDIDFRYYNTSKVYPVINSKIVTSHTDPERTVIIFGCNIKTQGALVAAYECADSDETPNAYLQSNLKVYVSESSIMAKSITTGTIKANSIYFCDDVRTNVVSTANITFANDILATKVSDGLYHVLYTSHDYATITWSDGVTEHWASGSTPNSYEHRFDGITAGGLTEDQNKVSYNSTGSSFPFGLLANLTLSDRIGFNVYVPTTLKNGTSVSTSDVKIYLDGKEISANCYPGTSTVRTSIVAAATGYGDGYCYDYTLTLAPQEAAKSFTIVIVYGGQCVSRTVSVADYATSLINKGTNEKNLALLSVTLAYIEEATKFAGYTVDMSKIKSLRSTLGTKTATIQAPVDPEITHGETEADFSKYFAGVQLNVKESGAFRFRLADGVSADGFKFYIANDKNDGYELREHKVITVNNEIYLELSLRAFEMARSIKIVNGGEYDLYSLYQCYNATKTMANETIDVQGKAYTAGKTYEYKAALTLIETMYHYASICDKYLDKNAAEYQPAN